MCPGTCLGFRWEIRTMEIKKMILIYELVDNPGHEYQDEVVTQFDACVRLQSIEPFCVWWQLLDDSGEPVMSS